MKPIMTHLREDQIARLAQERARTGASRSEIIRRSVDIYLNQVNATGPRLHPERDPDPAQTAAACAPRLT